MGEGIRIATVTGSVRPGNFTSKALALVQDEIRNHGDIALDVIDPARMRLPPPGTDTGSVEVRALRKVISQATGIVLATPEYHGSVSSVLKLVIENLGFPSTLAGKPVVLLGVASGAIGAVKALEHLRSICAHVGALVLPGAVSVPAVNRVFDGEGRCLDEEIERRIRGVATGLIDHIHQAVCPKMAMERMVREGGR
ncbi:NAD(P)H-dependent oxidoreductase [Candidatus Sumerlaeota bacterium]|nr:NAD(P)H-dependent oxidoreductase [Candidatus Sumerlaeota bacterium]